jgi:alpha-methylacyl-CoA racemase
MALRGVRVLEFQGIGPAPFATMVLADYGAKVVRVDRKPGASGDVTSRGKSSVVVDVKNPAGKDVIRSLIKQSDVLVDPYRPGVMEKLGFGPAECEKINPRLIFARMVGFSPTSPYGKMAGHDLNYIAVSGVLDMIRSKTGEPTPPMNILGDFAGGGIMLVQGILLALLERASSGKGQVVKTDMVNGARYISSFPLLFAHPANTNSGMSWHAPPGHNRLDGGCPFYGVYKCRDGGYMTVGCLEPQFFAEFSRLIRPFLQGDEEIAALDPRNQNNEDMWGKMRLALTRVFLTNDRDEWARVFHGTDACALPVLTKHEVTQDQLGGAKYAQPIPDGNMYPPAPHPILERTPANPPPAYTDPNDFYVAAGSGAEDVIKSFGNALSADDIKYIRKANGGAKL